MPRRCGAHQTEEAMILKPGLKNEPEDAWRRPGWLEALCSVWIVVLLAFGDSILFIRRRFGFRADDD
jgi:hypothetical protein